MYIEKNTNYNITKGAHPYNHHPNQETEYCKHPKVSLLLFLSDTTPLMVTLCRVM